MAKKKKKKKKAKLVGVVMSGAKTKTTKKKGKTKSASSKKTKSKNTTQKSAAKYVPPSGLGCFGNTIVFAANANKLLPFADMKREVAGRWKEHEIVGKKPKAEFCGPDAQDVKMTITLSAEHGVKPRETMDAIAAACEKGTVEYLVVGGKTVGSNKMRIVSVGEAWERVMNMGELAKATLDVTFREYT